jgi:hypothetical protein
MQPSTAQKQQPSEDIDAILSRFQSWSGSRKATDSKDSVREISYEEALQTSRYRWQAHVPTPRITEPQGKRDLGPEPGVIPVPSPVPVPQSRPVSPSAIKAPSMVSPSVEPSISRFDDSRFDDDLLAPDTTAFKTTMSESRAQHTVREKSVASPEFRAVLTETVLPSAPQAALAKARAFTGEPERQLSMSLRVAASEHALIKIRAAEAGISASAYLRQCALEVEQLRAQVKLALDIIERNTAVALSEGTVTLQPKPAGFFTRVRQLVFGDRNTTLALRA